jgi:hypothetical protein
MLPSNGSQGSLLYYVLVVVATSNVGFLVLYEADIVLKFWLPMCGLGHCRTLKHMESLITVRQWV